MVFRGLNDAGYDLKTSLGRIQLREGRSIQSTETRMLKLFKESSIPYLGHKPQNELEWMALAQHHGLPTRLLDWSYNPLVSLFFAVESKESSDSAIYILSGCGTVQDSSKFNVFSSKRVYRYRPPYLSPRIQNQGGLFTIHPEPTESFKHDKMKKVIIPKSIKRSVKKTLCKYGINQRFIYPRLDGIVSDLKWLLTSEY